MKLETVFILRSLSVLQKEGGTASARAYKYSHHKEGIIAVVKALRELNIPYSFLEEGEFQSTTNLLKKQRPPIIIVPELRPCPDDLLNGLMKISEYGGTVVALYDSFYYNETGKGQPQRAITQRMTELFQIPTENFTDTVWFEQAELNFQNTRFNWLTKGLPSPHPYLTKHMLAVSPLGNASMSHGEMISVEVIKFDDKTEPVRKESRFPAFLIREFGSGGIFIYVCFTLRKIENYKQILGNLVMHYSYRLEKEWHQQNEVATSPADSKSYQLDDMPAPGWIFISYRRSDSADIAGRIYDRLIDKFGRNLIFKDVDSIPLGIDFKEYLDKTVSESNVLLAIIGDRWVEASDGTGKKRLEDPDDFVRIEIESALERGIPVIPLLVRDAKMPSEENLPNSLRKLAFRNGIQIRPDPDFHRDMDRLIRALDKYIQ